MDGRVVVVVTTRGLSSTKSRHRPGSWEAELLLTEQQLILELLFSNLRKKSADIISSACSVGLPRYGIFSEL